MTERNFFCTSPEAEASKEFARNYGETHLTHAWVLTPFDVWEKNPFYIGPAVPHPEDNQ